jgi:ATP-dependent helicase/nuclease subunit B
MPRRPVFTIPASSPFLPTLASAMIGGELVPGFSPRNDPMALAAATVFLPTRRAARAFEYAILDALGQDAALLPRIVPLGDLDEDALAFSEDQPTENVLPAATATERRLVLAGLVGKFAESGAIAASPASAIKLADELARLFDDLTTASVAVEELKDADLPGDLDKFWQQSVKFVQLAWTGWRAYLREQGKEDPAMRRDLLLARKAEDLRNRKGGPFIAAGSTGTIPAVANLLVAIAGREDGAVVLPGLDQRLDEASFRMVGAINTDTTKIDASYGHPQFGLSRLLARLKISREDVRVLGREAGNERAAYLSEAFRPAESTDRWGTRAERVSDAQIQKTVETLTVVEAADPREEALAAAIVLRQSIEEEKRTAFVTHDRSLARRVAAELRRWDILVDDSAGIPLAESEAGRFARLAAMAAGESLAPVPLLAFLRHPLNRLANHQEVDTLELAALRGPRPAAGAKGLMHLIERSRGMSHHRRDHRFKLTQTQWDVALTLAKKTAAALEPLLACEGKCVCAKFSAAHRAVLERCGLDFARDGVSGAYELSQSFAALEQSRSPLELDLLEYAGAFAELLRGEPPVRRDYDPDDRIRILGPLEARLLQADRILLGGMNEGTWPPEAHSDAWLNRPLRKRLGLDLPERRIGLAAHDFVQALGTQDAVLLRARKQNGVETVASRFLQRLAAIAPENAWANARARGSHLLSLAHVLEQRLTGKPAERPAPKPLAEARPSQLSVTEIETLVRDPYSIYARHVLGLNPLDELDADPGAAERGTILHEAFAEFVKAAPQALPEDALTQLLAAGKTAFAAIADYPELHAIWWPRFVRAAEWLIGEERTLREGIEHIYSEVSGSIEFNAGGRKFRLTARADRIDRRKDGAVAVFDYKTGRLPTLKEAILGFSPQMPLEAAIAKSRGFSGLSEVTSIAQLSIVRVTGGQPAGEIRSLSLSTKDKDIKDLIQRHDLSNENDLADFSLRGCIKLIEKYSDTAFPYQSLPRPRWKNHFGEYDHLARIKEWSANEEGSE